MEIGSIPAVKIDDRLYLDVKDFINIEDFKNTNVVELRIVVEGQEYPKAFWPTQTQQVAHKEPSVYVSFTGVSNKITLIKNLRMLMNNYAKLCADKAIANCGLLVQEEKEAIQSFLANSNFCPGLKATKEVVEQFMEGEINPNKDMENTMYHEGTGATFS